MENTLDTSADILAQNRILYGSSYGYNQCQGVTTDSHSRAVLHAGITAGNELQRIGFDKITDQNSALANLASEARLNDKFSNLSITLATQFSQIDRRFSDMALSNQACCCELKAGQATILANIECQDKVRAAEDRVRADAKLDVLLSQRHNNG